jgi:hypothetical protein
VRTVRGDCLDWTLVWNVRACSGAHHLPGA